MPRNGTLSISAGMAERECGVGDDFVYIAVSDTGIGMDAATLQRARQPRFSTKVNGKGLGLAMVGDFVARHGGRWSIASEQDAGTTVTLLLPVDTGCKNEHMVAEPPQTRQRRPVFYVSSSD